ncbi:hypothetical protein QTP88_006027 [Uroleucon formosanum]
MSNFRLTEIQNKTELLLFCSLISLLKNKNQTPSKVQRVPVCYGTFNIINKHVYNRLIISNRVLYGFNPSACRCIYHLRGHVLDYPFLIRRLVVNKTHLPAQRYLVV